MKVRVIRRFYDAKTKKPHTLRKEGDIYSPSKKRAEALAKDGFVKILEEDKEAPTGDPKDQETK